MNATGSHRLAHQNGIEPAATAASAGHSPKFATTVTQRDTNLVVLLGGEWPLAYPRGVGLADPQHVTDGPGADPAASRRLRGDSVRRGDERIGPVVNVKQRPLRALEQYPLSFAALVVQQRPHPIHI